MWGNILHSDAPQAAENLLDSFFSPSRLAMSLTVSKPSFAQISSCKKEVLTLFCTPHPSCTYGDTSLPCLSSGKPIHSFTSQMHQHLHILSRISLQQDAESSSGEGASKKRPQARSPYVKCTSPPSLISQVLICTYFQFFPSNLLKQVWLRLPLF